MSMSGPTTSAASDGDGWWYQRAGEEKGPLSRGELRALFASNAIAPDTLVWCQHFGEEWKRIDATDLAGQERLMRPPPLPSSSDKKWEPIFSKFDQAQGFYYKYSILGFLFGFLYYFYLRMWRKGFVILGISIWAWIALLLTAATFDWPSLPKLAGLTANAFCGVFVIRDYYKARRFGERMWPQLHWLDRSWAIAILNIVPIFIYAVLMSIANADTPSSSSLRSGTPVAASDEPARAVGTPRMNDAEKHRLVETNCSQWLEQAWGGKDADQYDPRTVYTRKVVLQGGDIFANSNYFGGKQVMNFNAQVITYKNGYRTDSLDLPLHVCVIADDLRVIGVEGEMKDGVR